MRTSRRRLAAVAATGGALVVGAFGFAGPAAAQSFEGGLCTLTGTANFHGGGLTIGMNDFTYDFGGVLENCQSADGAALTAAVSAGQTIQGPDADGDGNSTYQQPAANGNGGCQSSTTSGVSFVEWSDGTLTIIGYDTVGALAAVELTGTVLDTFTLTEVGGDEQHTFTTTRFAGGQSLGQLVFETDQPQACQTGLASATIQGVVGTGNAE